MIDGPFIDDGDGAIEVVPKPHVDKIIAEKDAEIERLKAKIHSLECSLSAAGNLLEHQTGILKKLGVMEE